MIKILFCLTIAGGSVVMTCATDPSCDTIPEVASGHLRDSVNVVRCADQAVASGSTMSNKRVDRERWVGWAPVDPARVIAELEAGTLPAIPQTMWRLFALERLQRPGDEHSAVSRDLGVILWSGDGNALFQSLFGGVGSPDVAEPGEFPQLRRMYSDGCEIRYSALEIEELQSELDLAGRQYHAWEREMFGLRAIRFACEEAIRTGATLIVRDGALDVADVPAPSSE